MNFVQLGKSPLSYIDFDLAAFPGLLSRYLLKRPLTRPLEIIGKNLATVIGASEPEALNFFDMLLSWGGGRRNYHRVLSDPAHATEQLNKCIFLADRGQVLEAFAAAQDIFGIGPTYASKVLRFIKPEIYVSLDKKIEKRLGWHTADYVEWCKLCSKIGRMFGWPAADVEAAVFEFIMTENQ